MEEDSVCFKMSWKGGCNNYNKIKGRLYIFCFPMKLKKGERRRRKGMKQKDSAREIWEQVMWVVCYSHENWFSVQFSHSVVSDCLWPHDPQHVRLPYPSPTPGVHPNPCPSSRWCHPTISSSVVPFSSCPQSFPASGSFQMGQLFASDGQSIAVSASTSVLPMNTQDWSPLGWTGWISWQSKGLSRVFSNTTVQKYQFFGAQLSV